MKHLFSRLPSWGILLIACCLFGCEDFITIPPPKTELVQSNVFEDDATALSAMSAIYVQLANTQSFAGGGSGSITLFEGVYADELVCYASPSAGSQLLPFYQDNVLATSGLVLSTWNTIYTVLYDANRVIEGLSISTGVSVVRKDQLMGEALFIRAFCHFYLVNLFGDVPLVNTSDYLANAKASRTPQATVYASIIDDLLKAKGLLLDSYPSVGRVRPNKGAATALLARTYLYTRDSINAEAQASEIINKNSQYKLSENLDTVFLYNSEEAIWQLIPSGGASLYTEEGFYFILVAPPSNVALRSDLANAFESGDLRRKHWVDSLRSTSGFTKWYFAHKYKQNYSNGNGTEYSMILRLAEQYLIRAEARAKQNKLTGDNSAESDINIIRNRAGLPNTTATTKDQLLAAIEKERRMELFTEWGHRFFDLKRTKRLDTVMDPLKSSWDTTDALLPLPQSEILINKNLKQNKGY